MPRGRLSLLLDTAARQKLTTVVAPTGYGKTVLVSQWAHSQRSARIRWLNLGPADNEPGVLADRLATVLDGRDRIGARQSRSLLDDSFIDRLVHLPPTSIVLDDFQELTDPACRDDLATLIEHAPRGVHFLLASQVDPPSRFYRLSLSDAVVELRQADLSFTVDEAHALVLRLTGLDLTGSQVETLVSRTEGWAAGLQLAALSMRQRDDIEGFLQRFAGEDRNVVDYLSEHVLDRQDEPLREFLLRTSVLDRMTGSLCDEVTGTSGSHSVLEDLARKSVFTTTLDPGGRWFRYHQLFRATLRSHLRHRKSGMERDLLLAAASWHLGRGDLESGVRYLAEAGEWAGILRVASQFGAEMMARGRASTLAGWVSQARGELPATSVPTMLVEAAGWAISGSETRAREVLDTVDRSGRASSAERTVGDLLRAYAVLRGGRVSEAVRIAERVLVECREYEAMPLPDVMGLTSSPSEVAIAAEAVHGAALALGGRLEEARRPLERATSSGHPMWQALATGCLATVDAWSGRLSAAERSGRRALALLSDGGTESEHTALPALVGLAVVARERDDLDRARALLQEARALCVSSGDRLVRAILSLEQALLELSAGRISAGLTELRAHWPGVQDPLPEAVQARRLAAEAQLLIMAGEKGGAARALALAPEEHYEVAAARVVLAVERGDIQMARRVLQSWPQEPQPRAGRERLLWLAVVEHLDGNQSSALQILASVVDEAAPEQSIGMFRRHHIVAPARSLYRESPNPFLRAISDRAVVTPSTRRARGLVEQLTDREYMMLPLLPTRLTNVEMADTLGVSLNTVKTHLKHIYRKLGVTERSQAIAAAERLHLW